MIFIVIMYILKVFSCLYYEDLKFVRKFESFCYKFFLSVEVDILHLKKLHNILRPFHN